MPQNDPKVLLIGLDGATWKIIKPLLKKGVLPNLEAFLSESAHGVLQSTYPSMSPPAWTTFLTGVNPGKHQIFNFLKRRQNNGELDFFDSTDIKAKKIWHYLEKNHKKSLIINLPFSYPPEELFGILITSFMTPPGNTYTHPAKVGDELNQIGYEIEMEIQGKIFGNLPKTKLTQDQKKELLERIHHTSKKRVEAYKLLSSRDSFDFQFICFRETDYLQHVFYDDEFTTRYYKRFDDLFKQIIDHFKAQTGEEHSVILMSDHGFHPMPKVQFSPFLFLNQISSNDGSSPKTTKPDLLRKAYSITKHLKLTETLPFLKKSRSKIIKKLETDKTNELVRKWGILPTYEGIYILNPSISPFDKKELVKELKKATYKNSPVFSYIATNEDTYSGPFTQKGPDIVWQPNKDMALNMSPLANKLFMPHETHLRGDHLSDSEGIYAIKNTHIQKGQRQTLKLEDVLPMILYFLDTPIPDHIDGQVPRSLFAKKIHLKKNLSMSEADKIEV